MNTKVNKAYFLIPVIYLAVIIFLLYMQFSGSSGFYAEVTGITISGERQSGAPGKDNTITELSIRSGGLNFSFGEENPALVFSQDGLTHSTIPEDFRVTASGIDIRLSKGLLVSFYHPQNDSENLHITVTAEDPESIKYIHLPVIGEESQISASEGVPVLSVKSDTLGNFFLTLPESGFFEPETESIVLYPASEGSSELILERTAGSGMDAFTYWINGDAELITDENLKKMISSYIYNASESLLGDRYNAARGTWTMGNGISEFNENALVMAAVENIGKPSYRNAISRLNQAAASHNSELTILSSALFGNIVNEGWVYEQYMQGKVLELTRKAEDSDISIFSDVDLVTAVLTEDSDDLIRYILALIETSTVELPSLKDAISMLSFYADITEIYPEGAAQFAGVQELIKPVILPTIRVMNNRLYISESGKTADMFQTIRTGILLMNRIYSNSDENYSAIGRELIHSVLLLADEQGFLPETLTAEEGLDIQTEGILTPETIYPLITDNPYYPAADYFYEETGEKISVLNQAETFNVEKTDFGYRMKFDFPAGQTHIFAVRNIKPFYQMHLLGYKWNPDHRFLTYSSGWWFDRQHNTLFVKINHRMKTEEILIYTQPPPAPPAPPAEPAVQDTPEGTAEDSAAEVNSGGL